MSILTAAAVLACIWTYGTDLRGQKISINGVVGQQLVDQLQPSESREKWQKEKASRVPNGDAFQRNTYAAILLLVGEVQPAIELLHRIEREEPGRYPTAANLGTAYELAGNNAEALKWIRQSIMRSGDAHYGTEWLHVRILEAKLAMASDPKWLETHSILGIDFGDGPIPKTPSPAPKGNAGKPVSNQDLRYALWYQLHERYQFVKAPDPIVGSLLFDWANISYRTETLESAEALYREAIRFGAPRSDLARVRLARVQQILRDHTLRKK